MLQRIFFCFALLCSLGWSGLHAEEKSNNAWSLHSAAGLPDWLKLSVQHRARYETLSDTFKRNGTGGDQVLALRTNLMVEAVLDSFRIGAELIDSRSELDDSGTPVNTSLVNEVALVQAYLAWQGRNFLGSGLDAEFKFGRQTMDVGSRRLIARNKFRNTINNFNGFDFTLRSGNNWHWRNFVVLPVSRLPNNAADIRRGVVEFDEENFNVLFAGSFLSIGNLPFGSTGELYFFQLSEEDTAVTPSANRHLSNPGLRWFRPAAVNRFDFELESALQNGTSRASTSASDIIDLDHFAYFGHVALGYTFDLPWQPRFLLQYDYASGDKDPTDGNNGRYDTLFGARRFEFGPTGIWGAFARSNINTPGIRLEIKPGPTFDAYIAHRAYWLAENRDQWVGSGISDPSGRSGSFIGQQTEIRIRWNAIPDLVKFESGWAHLYKGDFAKNAPGAPTNQSDSNYFYAATTLAF